MVRRLSLGSSLLETVIALFVLTAAMIVSFQLFHRASAWQGEIELRAMALALAQSRVAELEIESMDLTNFRGGLIGEVGTRVPTGHPEFSITVAIDNLSTGGRHPYSPSRAFEKSFQGAPPPQPGPIADVFGGAVSDDRKIMDQSMLVADVTVDSRAGRMSPIVLTTLLREPPRVVDRVIVQSPIPSSLGYTQVATCQASAVDSANTPIDDVVVRWMVKPITSFGTVYQSRDGSLGALQYIDFNHLGVAVQPPPGEARLTASVRVEGRQLWGQSDIITLRP